MLTAEALEPELPLADGGYNRATVLVTNASARPANVTVTASAAAGISAEPERGRVTVPGRRVGDGARRAARQGRRVRHEHPDGDRAQ